MVNTENNIRPKRERTRSRVVDYLHPDAIQPDANIVQTKHGIKTLMVLKYSNRHEHVSEGDSLLVEIHRKTPGVDFSHTSCNQVHLGLPTPQRLRRNGRIK